MKDAQQIANRIAEIVNERDHVSFVELQREWPEHFRDGEMGFGPKDKDVSNVFYWLGMSDTEMDALNLALGSTIKLVPCAPLSYFIDGAVPKMPIARSLRHYKTPRWCPVVMRPVGARDSKIQGAPAVGPPEMNCDGREGVQADLTSQSDYRLNNF